MDLKNWENRCEKEIKITPSYLNNQTSVLECMFPVVHVLNFSLILNIKTEGEKIGNHVTNN